MKNFKSFLAGVITTLIISSLSVSALAITNRMTISVDPINIQVNGETFQPKDINGQDVPVFAYNGTTYAPLRALAEAYGLEVGYDSEKNMATVVDPDAPQITTPTDTPNATDHPYSNWSVEEEAAYQEFKAMWNVELVGYGDGPNGTSRAVAFLVYHGNLSAEELETFLRQEVSIEMHTALLKEFTNEDYPLSVIRFYHEVTENSNEVLRVSLYDGQAWII